jgi:rubrerythrin
MTTEANANLLAGLEMAIQAERDGYAFYTMASRGTDDEQGKATFERLAHEEAEHATFLELHYKAILETGAPDANAVLGPRPTFPEAHPIFSEHIKERLADARIEISALSIGAQLELTSRHFYREQAGMADDQVIKGFYEELAAWEGEHYTALMRQLDEFKEDRWRDARFSPLY